MRFQLFASMLCIAFLAMLTLTLGCTKVPVASMMKLARTDFETTDLSAVRAAVLLPSYLRPLPGTTKLVVTLGRSDGTTVEETFILRETDDAEADLLNEESKRGERIYAYALPPQAVRTLETARREAKSAPASEKGKRSLTLGVAAEACRVSRLPAGPLLITTYLKTAETRSFVPLTRDVDMRSLTPGTPLTLPLCPRQPA